MEQLFTKFKESLQYRGFNDEHDFIKLPSEQVFKMQLPSELHS
jgi:hypothetical protein